MAEVLAVGSAVKTVGVGERVVVPFQISCGSCDRCGRGVTADNEERSVYAMYPSPLHLSAKVAVLLRLLKRPLDP